MSLCRRCPGCATERPLEESFCEGPGTAGAPCGWDLTLVAICSSEAASGEVAPSARPGVVAPPPMCPQGHAVALDDLICLECGADLGSAGVQEPRDPGVREVAAGELQAVACWRILAQGREALYEVEHVSDGRRGLLALHPPGEEVDLRVQEALERVTPAHVPPCLERGTWEGGSFEVYARVGQESLVDLPCDLECPATLRAVVRALWSPLSALAEQGVRLRALHPATFRVRSQDPLEVVLLGFGSACCSALDLELEPPRAATAYMAPEAVMGVVSPASDWWSMGMVLLHLLTHGAIFEGVAPSLFVLHAMTGGVSLPPGCPPSLRHLLRGLLQVDRRVRWQGAEVAAWLEDRPPPLAEGVEAPLGVPMAAELVLAGRAYRDPRTFALDAARAEHWEEALRLLTRGELATWAERLGAGEAVVRALRSLTHQVEVDGGLRLAVALKLLHPVMPLVACDAIITPGWLLQHPQAGWQLITSPLPELLQTLGMVSEAWLWQLARRLLSVRERAERLGIRLDEPSLQMAALSTSRSRLQAVWEQRRALLPDARPAGLAALVEQPPSADEDLVLLLAACPSQLRSREEILQAARTLAAEAGVLAALPEALASLPRRALYQQLQPRLEGFARCGHEVLDGWADQLRLERRLEPERALVLLALPAEAWQRPPHQEQVARLLGFFERRIAAAILRGPLVRMVLGRTTPRVDLCELAVGHEQAQALLDQLVMRGDRPIAISPAAFIDDPTREARLRALQARTQLVRRDTGVDGLYLGYPFLLLRDLHSQARPRIAPVLLWPVRLRAETGARAQVSLAYDREREDVRLNPALEGLLAREEVLRWREVADALRARAALRAVDVIDAMATLMPTAAPGAEAPLARGLVPLPARDVEVPPGACSLVMAAVLFHVDFLGQAILQDLRSLIGMPPTGTALQPMLGLAERSAEPPPGDPAWLADLPQPARPAPLGECVGGSGEAPEPPSSRGWPRALEHRVAPSDPSQEQVIERAWELPGLLVQGPPGTGKSQAIVNLVADAIGRGRTLLVICQKLPALEVVCKRLVAEGLGARLLMVRDVHRDRSGILQALRSQLEDVHAAQVASSLRPSLLRQVHDLEQALDAHHSALYRVDARSGLSYRELLGELIEVERELPDAPEIPALARFLGEQGAEAGARLGQECAALVELWLEARPEGSPLQAVADVDADPATVAELGTHLQRFLDQEAERLALPAGAWEVAEERPLAEWLTTHALALQGLAPTALGDLARWHQLVVVEASTRVQALESLRSRLLALPEVAEPDVAVYAALSDTELLTWIRVAAQACEQGTLWDRLHPGRWWARRRLAALLEMRGRGYHVGCASQVRAAAALERDLRPLRRELLLQVTVLAPDQVSALQSLPCAAVRQVVDDLLSRWRAQLALHAIVAACPLPQPLRQAAQEGQGMRPALDTLRASLARCRARHEARHLLQALSRWMQPAWLEAAAHRVAAHQPTDVAAILAALSLLEPYLRFRARARGLDATVPEALALLVPARGWLEAQPLHSRTARTRALLWRHVCLGVRYRLEAEAPVLLASRHEIDSRIQALAAAEAELLRLNRAHLAAPDSTRVAQPQAWEAITRFHGPRALRLREVVQRGLALGLMTLRPVWLMTPEVASQLLPRNPACFDLVVYDEASQLPVEMALPTLYRARGVLVSGDERQMPPSSFFGSRLEDDEDDLTELDEPAGTAPAERHEEAWSRHEVKDCPDLLHLAKAVLPQVTLQVHYRSLYRPLIAFSSAAFYQGQLSVPACHSDEELRRVRPVEYIHVGGVYHDQVNEAEAHRVVAWLAELWSSCADPPSVGVVTFNRRQADLIEACLEARAEVDPSFRAAYEREQGRLEDGEDMGIFVKNVENVQGDERDRIVFSTTFGPGATGTFRRSFGVLGQRGGERRLNVAVTRARHGIVVMGSMPIEAVSDFVATSRPPTMARDYLQAYLAYARMVSEGKLDDAHRLLERLIPDRRARTAGARDGDGLTRSVERAVRGLGYVPVPVAEDPTLAVSMAVVDPRTGRYGLGIECEVPRHPLLAGARAREVWRPAVLAKAWPALHRVAAREWYHDREREMQGLAEALRRALT